MRGQKGQLMLFVIAGIVILLLLALIFFMSNLGKNTQVGPDGKILSKQSEEYLRRCTTQNSQEAVKLVGLQGGVIYDTQAEGGKKYLGPPEKYWGTHVLPIEINNTIYAVSYGITNPEFDSHLHPSPPHYPYGENKVLVSNPDVILNGSYVNMYGNYPEPGPFVPLCDYNGLNSPLISDMQHSCETYDSRNKNKHASVQEYIEAYIRDNTYKCFMRGIDNGDIPEFQNVTLNSSDVNVSTLITNEKVIVFFDFPAEIDVGSQLLEVKDQEITVYTRLKLMHELASHLIDRDVNDIFFDMVRDAEELRDCKIWSGTDNLCLKEKMSVGKVRNPLLSLVAKYGTDISFDESAEYNDIYQITDEDPTYSVSGREYNFFFAIENRPPALDFIYQTHGTLGAGFEIIVIAGEKITIDPEGFDPDEELYSHEGMMVDHYHYYKWKETSDDAFNHIKCSPGQPTYDQCLIDPWMQSVELDDEYPHNWTNSDEYQETRRNASIITDLNDRGGHILRVEVCDEGGLCDYQDIRILVTGVSSTENTNFFDDIDNKYASLEDPYRFAFPIPPMTAIDLYKYKLYKASGDLVWDRTGIAENYDVPQVAITAPPVKPLIFPDYFPLVGEYAIKYEAFNGGSVVLDETGGVEVHVTQCLPHRSDDEPYPFNEDDWLKADHTCCKGDPGNPSTPGWGTYEASDKVCFNTEEYGCRDDAEFVVHAGTNPSPSYYLEGGLTNLEKSNAVYKRVYQTRCSGDIGNACTGSRTDDRYKVEVCGECSKCQYGIQVCVPADAYVDVCNDDWRCSEGPMGQYDNGGAYFCQATCNMGGTCDAAVNCRCDSYCGGTCEEGTYEWDGTTCNFDCSIHADCSYSDSGTTICSAPNPSGSFSSITYDGETYQAGAAASASYVGSSADSYISYCDNNNKCIISRCHSAGVIDFSVDDCYPPGQVGDICYLSNSPRCSPEGVCLSGIEKPEGAGNICYHTFNCDPSNPAGWTYLQDPNKPATGYWVDGADPNLCMYGDPLCIASAGWQKPTDHKSTGDTTCGNTGWY